MKTSLITSTLLLFVGAVFAQSHKQYDYKNTDVNTTVEWNDIIEWTSTDIVDNRDKYRVNMSDANSTVTVSGGNNITIKDGGSVYLDNNTNLVIGDKEGDTKTEFRITTANKDTFLEMTGNSSILVQKNGILTIEGGHTTRYWGPQTGGANKDFFVVDGGTVNGNVGLGTTSGNHGFINTIFKNGATLNRTGQVNPLGISGKANFLFDNSTYNVWSADYTAQNSGWGNHIINTGPDSENLYATYTFTNGSIVNGAGYLKDGVMTYFDFSTDMVKQNAEGTDIRGVGLTLQPGRQLADDGYFRFEILNGAKVSANGMNLGNNANQSTKTHDVDGVTYLDVNYGKANSQITMGEVSFIMKSDDANNMAQFQGFGGTNLMGSRAVIGTETSTFNMKFTLAGNAKYYTLGDFNIGTGEDTSGTINVDFTNNNNVFKASNINIYAGQNATNLDVIVTKEVKVGNKTYAELVSNTKFDGSTEVINANFGGNTTNSTFTFNGMNVNAGKYTKVNINFAGLDKNTFTNSGDININTATVLGGNSVNTFEVSGPGKITFARNLNLRNYASGTNYFIVSGGANVTVGGGAHFQSSNVDGGTAKSYYIIDGSTLTTKSDCGYGVNNNKMSSGEVGFILKGNGAKYISEGQMNIYPGNDGNVAGIYKIRLEGTNGLFQAQKNLHMSGKFQGADAAYVMEIVGSGNTVNVTTGNFNLGNDNSTAGTYSVYSKSSSATAKNQILLGTEANSGGNGFYLHGTTLEGGTQAHREVILAGNTVLKRTSGERVTINVMEDGGRAYTGGTALFEISGSGNEVYAGNFKFGNDKATGGTATLRISGGGSDIDVSTLRISGGDASQVTTTVDNRIGGVLEFKLDDTGISTINTAGIDGDLDGILSIDFSGFTKTCQDERFVLISAKDNNLQSKISKYWYDFLGECVVGEEGNQRMEIKSSNLENESYYFAVEDSEINAGYKDFVVYYTGTAIIPEPSTYATIFGALALAFVAYRRKK